MFFTDEEIARDLKKIKEKLEETKKDLNLEISYNRKELLNKLDEIKNDSKNSSSYIYATNTIRQYTNSLDNKINRLEQKMNSIESTNAKILNYISEQNRKLDELSKDLNYVSSKQISSILENQSIISDKIDENK